MAAVTAISAGIKVRLPGEVKRAVNPPFLSPRELEESAQWWLRAGEVQEVGGCGQHCAGFACVKTRVNPTNAISVRTQLIWKMI